MPGSALRQEDFIGVWEMLSLRRYRDGVVDRFPMGEAAWGRLIYGPGTMSAFIMSPAWRAGEEVPPFENLVSYAASWEYADGLVRHFVLASCIPAWEGTTLVRTALLAPDGTLALNTEPHTNKRGMRVYDELRWRKRPASPTPLI